MDYRCSHVSFMGLWISKQLHDGWVHSYFAGNRPCGDFSQNYSGPQTHVAKGLPSTCLPEHS